MTVLTSPDTLTVLGPYTTSLDLSKSGRIDCNCAPSCSGRRSPNYPLTPRFNAYVDAGQPTRLACLRIRLDPSVLALLTCSVRPRGGGPPGLDRGRETHGLWHVRLDRGVVEVSQPPPDNAGLGPGEQHPEALFHGPGGADLDRHGELAIRLTVGRVTGVEGRVQPGPLLHVEMVRAGERQPSIYPDAPCMSGRIAPGGRAQPPSRQPRQRGRDALTTAAKVSEPYVR